MQINRSAHFLRAYKKLPSYISKDFDEKIVFFFEDIFDPRLKTHRLHGRLHECFAFCLTGGYRVLFEYSEKHTIDLLDIGPHDLYKKR